MESKIHNVTPGLHEDYVHAGIFGTGPQLCYFDGFALITYVMTIKIGGSLNMLCLVFFAVGCTVGMPDDEFPLSISVTLRWPRSVRRHL